MAAVHGLIIAHERQSAVWTKVREHLNELLEQARRRNDADLTEVQTQKLRGRITLLKELLLLDQDPAKPLQNVSKDFVD